jgi:thioredoxin-like negative regulator of GroEL
VEREEFPITLVEIDVEKHPSITRHYQVKGTPELIFINDGEPRSSRLGTMSYDQLVEYVESELEPV